jgi:hypothetical protein
MKTSIAIIIGIVVMAILFPSINDLFNLIANTTSGPTNWFMQSFPALNAYIYQHPLSVFLTGSLFILFSVTFYLLVRRIPDTILAACILVWLSLWHWQIAILIIVMLYMLSKKNNLKEEGTRVFEWLKKIVEHSKAKQIHASVNKSIDNQNDIDTDKFDPGAADPSAVPDDVFSQNATLRSFS